MLVDTSALYAFLVAEDADRRAARDIMASLRARRCRLVSSSFVIQESAALLQSRIGIEAVRILYYAVAPVLEVVFIDEPRLRRAMESLLAASPRRISLTDWSSFAITRERGIDSAFVFDADFSGQGFELPRPG